MKLDRSGTHPEPLEEAFPRNMGKSNPITGLDRPWGFQEVEVPRFQDSRHMKVVRLSALRTGRLYPPGNIPGTHFCWRLSQPQGHRAAGRIMPIKNSSDTIGNRTRDLPTCIAVPQPTALPRTHRNVGTNRNIRCHRQDHVLCMHCKLRTVFRLWCGNQIIYTTFFAPLSLLSACTVKYK